MLTMQFVLGGKAIFTIDNGKGKHYTFSVKRKENRWFVSLLTGPDNSNDFTYIGMLNERGNFFLTKASKMTLDSVPVKVFSWSIKVMQGESTLPEGYSIRHEGKCCRCGRRLTNPESLDTGIGPECAKAA